MKGRVGLFLLPLVFGACHPRLPLRIAGATPPLVVAAAPARVLASSAAAPPAWLRGSALGGGVSLVGSGSGASEDEARAAARRDLDLAAMRYLSVDVAAESETVVSEREEDGRTSGTLAVHAESHARSEPVVSAVAPDAEYWEKVALDPAQLDRVTWRVHLRARPAPRDLDRARIFRHVARASATGRRTVLVLAASDAPREAKLIQGTLARQLSGQPGWAAGDVELITRAGLRLDEATRAQADVIAQVDTDAHDGRLRARVSLYDGGGGLLDTCELDATPATRFELEGRLATQLARLLTARFPRAERGTR